MHRPSSPIDLFFERMENSLKLLAPSWLQPDALLPERPDSLRPAQGQQAPAAADSDTPLPIISQQDVYHRERPVLLLKSGQRVRPKTLETLHRQGIPVTEICAVQYPDGTLSPLDHSLLRRIISEENDAASHFSPGDMEQVLDVQARGWHRAGASASSLPLAWQRHFKALVISESVAFQEKVRQVLEREDILPAHIGPVMQLSTFLFAYEKYRPTCLILDEATHYRFAVQGLNILAFIESLGGDNVECIVWATAEGIPVPDIRIDPLVFETVALPLCRSSLMGILEPVLHSIKRTYSNLDTPTPKGV
jgi:hypothetical protein